MKYFLDTEFHEYKKKPLFGKAIDTIELISIGIVGEDIEKDAFSKRIGKTDKTFTLPGIEYYAICKEFDIKAAWNSWQIKTSVDSDGVTCKSREYWLRENVLKPIFIELVKMNKDYHIQMYKRISSWSSDANPNNHVFNYKNFKKLINKYGKTKEQISHEIFDFIYLSHFKDTGMSFNEKKGYSHPDYDPEFYAYYADYDWVVLCWLFGRMIDLPKGFPMYCKDLKQIKDEKWKVIKIVNPHAKIEDNQNYPKQTNEHNALADAKWNKELYNFLNTL